MGVMIKMQRIKVDKKESRNYTGARVHAPHAEAAPDPNPAAFLEDILTVYHETFDSVP